DDYTKIIYVDNQPFKTLPRDHLLHLFHDKICNPPETYFRTQWLLAIHYEIYNESPDLTDDEKLIIYNFIKCNI
ncbi:MAG: hypothetical protein JWP44_5009, partial [Mucilaginibacter sp.]|nr:hypothetical protein [Mucilaginibacter sp.]